MNPQQIINLVPFRMDALEAWAGAVAFLFIKMYANTAVQFRAKVRDRVATLPEDRAAFKFRDARAESSSELYERAAGCWENDLENIPMFLLLCLGYVLLGGGHGRVLVVCVAFCAARTAHTVFYLRAMQPHRAVAYTLGALCSFALVVGIVARLV